MSSDWRTRVADELVDLEELYENLSTFMQSKQFNTGISAMQKQLLIQQKQVMSNYLIILQVRLDNE